MGWKTGISGCPGVYWNKRGRVWYARIGFGGRELQLGHFKNKKDAVLARKKAEEEYADEISQAKRDAAQKLAQIRTKYHSEEEKKAAYVAHRYRDPLRICLWGVKHRAKAKGLPFDLELSDLTVPECCEICKRKVYLLNGGMAIDDTATIDRIRPSMGYIKGNWWWLCAKCNSIKRDCDDPQYFIMIGTALNLKLAA